MKTINSILIANRGEIASRIIRTCKKMGIRSIAVYSDADRDAPYVAEADISVHIGESSPAASYLDQEKIIAVAKETGADALHPGFGFLAENADFARKCIEAGITFIGPSPEAIDAMGSKSRAKAIMQNHKVPTILGYQGEDQSLKTLVKAAKKVGFPLLLKATAGGGGKGMRIVNRASELEAAITSAQREAKSAFGDEELIIEKYISGGRHVEFQIFGDQHGNAIHLLERECTIQRRYQKVIEESPSPVLDEKLRKKMGEAAVKAAKAINYYNAGTVEFILEESGNFYFLEVNTRLQVEHPVTEKITGLDLVQLQIEVAEGRPLAITQKEVKGKGYAIECRLYAEDANNDFLPVTGTIQKWSVPKLEGLRIETGIQSNSEISIYYDPMIAKVITWAEDRAAAQRKMLFALRNLVCLGVTTNQDFLIDVLLHPDFQKGDYDIHFIQQKMQLDCLAQKSEESVYLACIAASLSRWLQREKSRGQLQALPSGWRNNFYEGQKETWQHQDKEIQLSYSYLNGQIAYDLPNKSYKTKLISVSDGKIRLEANGTQYSYYFANKGNNFYLKNDQYGNVSLQLKDRFPEKEVEKIKGGYESPMPSQVIKLLVKEGQKVAAGDGLIVLSSMKMENTIAADEAGTVEEIYAEEGSNIEAGFLLLKLTTEEA